MFSMLIQVEMENNLISKIKRLTDIIYILVMNIKAMMNSEILKDMRLIYKKHKVSS